MITHYPEFSSQFVRPRQVDVWLPPDYESATDQRYAVLYMHDGQNLFDPATSTLGVDEALERLIAAGTVPPTIIVGIWCTELRVREYLPQRPFAASAGQHRRRQLPAEFQGDLLADAYLQFLTDELKPFIDATYRTRPERDATAVMGSSMGGLISLYAVCQYPDLFAGAGCVSTHWPVGDGLVVEALPDLLPPPGRHKFYFDFGTETLDALYEPYQQRVDAVMAAAGYTQGQDWLTRKFPGAAHDEASWRERVHIPLEFLLGT